MQDAFAVARLACRKARSLPIRGTAVFAALALLFLLQPCADSQPQAPIAKSVGTIKAISGNTITLTQDSGPELSVIVQDDAKLVLVAPGQTNLKDAVPIQFSDLHPGDRILARGAPAADGKSVLAVSIIAMAKTEIAAKQARERDDWQRHGISGLVLSSDPPSGNIVIALPSLAEKKNITVHAAKSTVLRRYAPDSVKFDDAKPAPLDQIKAGDQLRARGARTPDGLQFNADEIVSGAFRNIAGTVSSIDASSGTLTVQDLAAKKSVSVRISADSQIHKLPPPIAQRIAARLKGLAPEAASTGGAASASATANVSNRAVAPANASGADASPRAASGGGDFQQMINRMPPISLADLQKGDAVMIVATEGSPNTASSVITLLAGVEPILQAAPSGNTSTILSPWSLSGQGGGEAQSP